MTDNIKYPEEIKHAETIKRLEHLQAKLRRREAEIKLLKEKSGDVLDDKDKHRKEKL